MDFGVPSPELKLFSDSLWRRMVSIDRGTRFDKIRPFLSLQA